MRRVNEAIEVRLGPVAREFYEAIGPVRFRWRRRWWRVLAVQSVWVETSQWWAAAGDNLISPVVETEIWVIDATDENGVGSFEVAHTENSWLLRTIID